jgi:ABC-type sulfate/molybdate transport systems ATPase subunit
MSLLHLTAVSRNAISRRVLDRIGLEVQAGELLALLGLPGSGRASLLRVIAGLEEPDEGRILLEGRDISRVPARRRPIGFLYQQDPLFGHPTVFEAVASALPEGADRPAPAASGARVQHLLGLVGLAAEAGSMPAMLTAPKRRRLLLARTLASEPRLLLVGEGFGPREVETPAPRLWLREVQQALGLTVILTAQSAAEALSLADRIAVLEEGRLVQIGTPAELRFRPASDAVARLLGDTARPRLAADAIARPQVALAAWRPLGLAGGLALPAGGNAPIDRWSAAEAVEVVPPGEGLPARVLRVTPLGGTLRLELELIADRRQVAAEVASQDTMEAIPPGTILGVRIRPDGLRPETRLN